MSATSLPEAGLEPAFKIVSHNGSRLTRPGEAVRNHDFRQAGVLTPSELRHITLRHEQFIRSAGARLALLLRMEFSLQLARLSITARDTLVEALPASAHITLFRLDPAAKAGWLVFPPRLALSLVDRLLGGPGVAPEGNRELSDIETALSDQVASLLLWDWTSHWPELGELRPAITGHESNGHFMQNAADENAMLVLTLNVKMGDQIETASLALAYSLMEPFIRQLAPAAPARAATATAAPASWKPEFDDVEIPATAEWRNVRVTAGQLVALKPGDVLMLGSAEEAEVQLRLNHIPKFRARPGVCGRKWAVQLTAAHE